MTATTSREAVRTFLSKTKPEDHTLAVFSKRCKTPVSKSTFYAMRLEHQKEHGVKPKKEEQPKCERVRAELKTLSPKELLGISRKDLETRLKETVSSSQFSHERTNEMLRRNMKQAVEERSHKANKKGKRKNELRITKIDMTAKTEDTVLMELAYLKWRLEGEERGFMKRYLETK